MFCIEGCLVTSVRIRRSTLLCMLASMWCSVNQRIRAGDTEVSEFPPMPLRAWVQFPPHVIVHFDPVNIIWIELVKYFLCCPFEFWRWAPPPEQSTLILLNCLYSLEFLYEAVNIHRAAEEGPIKPQLQESISKTADGFRMNVRTSWGKVFGCARQILS